MRGNREFDSTTFHLAGPIPACAGQPSRRTRPLVQLRAYPRVCGATEKKVEYVKHSMGLSPRVRGNLAAILEVGSLHGPIPACAGQPAGPEAIMPLTRAYPRVCGATMQVMRDAMAYQGLSPRVRGNPPLSAVLQWDSGPIPACAGQP